MLTGARDDEGFLDMSGFSDEEPEEWAAEVVFEPPPGLAESDWLAAVAQAVASPLDATAGSDPGPDEAGAEAEPPSGTGGDAGSLAGDWSTDDWPGDEQTAFGPDSEPGAGDPGW